MATDHSFDTLSFEIRPGKRQRIQQDFTNVVRKGITIPHPEMRELMPPEKQALETERREQMIYASDPLRHTVIVGVFGFDGELKERPTDCRGERSRVTADPPVRTDA